MNSDFRDGAQRNSSSIWSQIKAYLESSAWDIFVYPFLILCLRILFALSTSVVLYLIIYSYLIPKALIREPIYFDYTTVPPSARLNLLNAEKQWYYLNQKDNVIKGAVSEKGKRRFLLPGSRYSIDVLFNLAKSPRNADLGKFMLYLTMVDSTGDSIARSTRPVAMPYQSLPSLILDSMIKFPLRLTGLYQIEEVSSVRVSVMNDYREPTSSSAFSETVELSLSTSVVDIGDASLTIMPVLGGLTYYMHYYPRTSLFFGITALMSVQIFLYVIYLAVALIIKYLTTLSNLVTDDRQDMDERDYIEINEQTEESTDENDRDQERDDDSDGEQLARTWRLRDIGRHGDSESELSAAGAQMTPPSSSSLRRRSFTTPRQAE